MGSSGQISALRGLDADSEICHFLAMELSTYLEMDPHLLVGLLNTELRNHCDSLEDLLKTHHLDETALVEMLGKVDYIYQPGQNQFR